MFPRSLHSACCTACMEKGHNFLLKSQSFEAQIMDKKSIFLMFLYPPVVMFKFENETKPLFLMIFKAIDSLTWFLFMNIFQRKIFHHSLIEPDYNN